jgi:hypothetical protein
MAAALLTTLAVAMVSAHREEVAVSMPHVVQVNGVCSGFIADYGFVVTARHCVDTETPEQKVRFYDGVESTFRVATVGKDIETHDFAILAGDTRGLKPTTITDQPPPNGDVCYHVGYGGGVPYQVLIFCQVTQTALNHRGYLELSTAAIGGDSGSMVASKDHKVFGILVRSRFPIPTALAVRASYAKEAIQRIKGTPHGLGK